MVRVFSNATKILPYPQRLHSLSLLFGLALTLARVVVLVTYSGAKAENKQINGLNYNYVKVEEIGSKQGTMMKGEFPLFFSHRLTV